MKHSDWLAYRKRWRLKNIDKLRAETRAYYAANRDRVLVRQAKYRKENREYLRQRTKEWRRKNRQRSRDMFLEYRQKYPDIIRAAARRRYYNLLPEMYDALLRKQNGVCAICKGDGNGRELQVDHCHETHKVRGILCADCNSGIGRLKDDPFLIEKALLYLVETME